MKAECGQAQSSFQLGPLHWAGLLRKYTDTREIPTGTVSGVIGQHGPGSQILLAVGTCGAIF